MSTYFYMSLIVSLTFLVISLTVTWASNNQTEETTFECGMNSKTDGTPPFSFQFLLVALLFLIFDVEISLMVPFTIENWNIVNTNTIIFVMVVILWGVWYEWKGGKIKWSKWMNNLICK